MLTTSRGGTERGLRLINSRSKRKHRGNISRFHLLKCSLKHNNGFKGSCKGFLLRQGHRKGTVARRTRTMASLLPR